MFHTKRLINLKIRQLHLNISIMNCFDSAKMLKNLFDFERNKKNA